MNTDHRDPPKVSPGSEFEIFTRLYQSKIHFLESDLTYMERDHHYPSETIQTDVYSSLWLLGFIDDASDLLKVRSGGRMISCHGPMGIFVPPFSLVEWHISKGLLQWKCLTSTSILPEWTPKSPVIFTWDGKIPQTVAESQRLLGRLSQPQDLQPPGPVSIVAVKTKEHIDAHFTENLQIQELARTLGVSRSVASREFCKAFGISPVVYRHKLRVFEALRLMALGYNVTRASYETGFANPNRLIHFFRKYFSTTPRECCPAKLAKIRSSEWMELN